MKRRNALAVAATIIAISFAILFAMREPIAPVEPTPTADATIPVETSVHASEPTAHPTRPRHLPAATVPALDTLLEQPIADEPSRPIELGEPLEVEDTPWESTNDTIELGELLDADDPLGWLPSDDQQISIELGEPLDVDTDITIMDDGSEPIELGESLDADATMPPY